MTLTQIEQDDWGEPPYDSFLVAECHRLRNLPLRDLTVENLRLLIGQKISLPHTVPLALEHLLKDPMAEGDYGPGDLLKAVREIGDHFWEAHPSLATQWKNVRKP